MKPKFEYVRRRKPIRKFLTRVGYEHIATLQFLGVQKQNQSPRYCGCRTHGVSEFEIHAYLFIKLKELSTTLNLDWTVRGEVPALGGSRCKFDIVVFQGVGQDRPIRIIEVKRRKGGMNNKQLDRYRHHGIPVDVICKLKSAERYLALILKNNRLPQAMYQPYGYLRHLNPYRLKKLRKKERLHK